MFEIYAQVRGLNRLIVDVPVLTPRLSSLWVGLVTPISTAIAKPLIKGLDNEVVVTDDAARRLFSVDPTSYEAAVRLALRRFATDDVETSWHTAFSSSMDDHVVETLDEEEGMIKERRRLTVDAPPDLVFDVIRRIGGDTGWLYANPLWKIRGLMDLMVGGIGLRKSRRSYSDVRVGDAIDFWRVEAVEEERLLRLRAEMKVPGKAWLQFRVDALDDGRSRITQTAFYEPKGLFGLLYWWMLYPAHKLIFPGMIREIGRRAEVAALARQTKQLTSGTAPAP
jgi:hypothetical protein